jgi:starch phosphorylase
MEASGTSGQKVPLNGGINCSILDGWWAEGYNGANGWAVGNAVEGRSEAEQDRVDATALYEILEKEIVPLFYRRDRRGLPSRWIKKMKASMATLIPSFNTEAMVKNYVRQLYAPALNRRRLSESNRFAAAAEIAKVKVRLRENWPLVHVTHAEIAPRKNAKRNGSWRGKRLEVLAEVYLGELDPDLVQVELYTVAPSQNGTPERVNTIPLRPVHRNSDGVCRYQLKLNETPNELPSPRIRVRPRHQAMSHKHELGLIHWWELA